MIGSLTARIFAIFWLTLALVLINLKAYRERALDDIALENIRSMLSFFMQYQKLSLIHI